MRTERIWKYDFGYSFFRPYIEWTYRTCFSKIKVNGLENVPDAREASVIIATNHCNTMMDSLLVLQSRKEPVFFVARADIFKKALFAYLLTNLRILPIYRKRDCEDSLEKNGMVFDNVVDALNHGIAFCITPEGTHRARRSLLPFKKGAVRIAQQALESNSGRPVYIVPAGLEYDDYFNIMRPVSITYGEPLRITGDEDIDAFTEDLHDRISKLITYFPDDENLEAAEKAFYESRRPHYNVFHYIAAILLLPAFLVSGFLCSPILALTLFFKSKLKDKAWLNTVRFSCKLVLTPFIVAGAAIAGFIHWPWWAALLLAFATLYAHTVFYGILVFYKRLFRKTL